MKKQLAFVLGGGGARGALQVGALKALLEAGFHPDVLVGTSIGAVNATFLGMHAANPGCLKELIQYWQDATTADLLPSNYLWLTVRALFNRSTSYSKHRLLDFLVAHGLSSDLLFGDIKGVRLLLVAADINAGRPVIYGYDLNQPVLEGVLASTALPPWVTPIEKQGQILIDGGTVSNLPIEPAMTAGVTEIIALDLADPREAQRDALGFGSFLTKLLTTIEQRQVELEIALAAACNVKVRHVHLTGDHPIPLWDFSHTDEWIERGYEITCQEIARWQHELRPKWWAWLSRSRRKN